MKAIFLGAQAKTIAFGQPKGGPLGPVIWIDNPGEAMKFKIDPETAQVWGHALMSKMRVPSSVRAEALAAFRKWDREMFDRVLLNQLTNFGGIFNPPKGEAPPEAMVNLCPLCMGKVKRGNRTQHLMSVHKRSREDATSLIEKYCGQ